MKEYFIKKIESLGLVRNKPIVVAMSGGVDSSCIAAMLSIAGYKVIGLTMKLYEKNKSVKSNACCGIRDIEDARRVASDFKFDFYVLNYISRFEESVINDFILSYKNGETPIPCIKCNKELKFKDLLQMSKSLGAQRLVTGHYIIKQDNKLYRALDKTKDQSYFLFNINKEDIEYLEFPLGYFTKEQVRECAREINLHISDKHDSQDICFVHNNDYRTLIPESKPGKILDMNGNILGMHTGISNFTIGQRKGLQINSSSPLYVIMFDKDHNIIVGSKEDLLCTNIELKDINWFEERQNIMVKVRYSQEPVPASINKNVVTFLDPISRPAAGQACVFYDNENLLGGGWIVYNH